MIPYTGPTVTAVLMGTGLPSTPKRRGEADGAKQAG